MNFSGASSSKTQDVELNITPIIDCFTVLITFLLASASFLSIGFFEAYTPGNTADPTTGEPDSEAVVRITKDNTAELKIKGKRNYSLRFDLGTPSGLNNLQGEISKLDSQHLKMNQILLTAEDDVPYRQITEVMDQLGTGKLPVVVGEF